MSKAELKNAMESLQIKKPLKLRAPTPRFAPPASESAEATLVANPTEVEKATQVGKETKAESETLVKNSTQVDLPTRAGFPPVVPIPTMAENPPQVENPTRVENKALVGNQPKVETSALVENSAQVSNSTLVDIPTQVGEVALDTNPTQVEKLPQVTDETASLESCASGSRQAIVQDSSVVFDARTSDGLERGYTRLPNQILMQLVNGDFTRNEIKLALLIARFTISFQRKLAPLSKMVLERRSGLRGAAVLEAISGLVTKGVVEKQKGDPHRPNLLGLVLPADWESLAKPKRKAEATWVANPTLVENPTEVTKHVPTWVENPTSTLVGKATHFKETLNKISKLSSQELPESLQKYFSELKPAKKRESEWRAFESLKQEYPAEEISDCLEILAERGIRRPGQGTQEPIPCHSPMAYLSKAMGEVLCDVKARQQRTQAQHERTQQEADLARTRQESDQREETLWATTQEAFVTAYPSEEQQRERIAEYLGSLPFQPESQVGRRIGIGLWWQSEKLDSERKI